VRKAPEALDDLDIGAPVTTQRTAAIRISRQGFGKCQRAPLVSEIFAVMEWHIEEQPPGRRHHPVEPAFERPVRRGACRRIGRIGAGRPAKDVARHLIEQQHQGESALSLGFPREQHPSGCRFVIGEKLSAQRGVEFDIASEPDFPVLLAPRVTGRTEPEIE